MAVKLKRPILVGGIGLTCGAWLWSAIAPSVADVAGASVWGAIAIGTGVWLLKGRSKAEIKSQPTVVAKPVTPHQVEQALTKVKALIERYVAEADAAQQPPSKTAATAEHLQASVTQIHGCIQRSDLRLTILGDQGAGKSSLHRWLQTAQSEASEEFKTAWMGVSVTESQCLPDAKEPAALSETCNDADLVLFVVSGDLTDSSFHEIRRLAHQRYRVVVVFNQSDRYLPDERSQLLQHLQRRLDGVIQPQDIVSVAIAPAPIKVRQYNAAGSMQVRMETVEPDGASLLQRLSSLLTQERQQICLLTALRQAETLHHQVQSHINEVRRSRALPIIEEYQWIAAAAAFANPVPTLDVMAIAAVNAQLVIDLGQIYNLQFSTAKAATIAGTLGELMVKLGLAELASQAISPLLKGNLMTFTAGGAIQGVSAAYLTRIAGLSLVEYFEQQALISDPEAATARLSADALLPHLQAVFQNNRRAEFLKLLVKQSLARVVPSEKTSKAATVELG